MHSPGGSARARQVAQRAAGLPAPEREAFLDRECAGDAALRAGAAAALVAMDTTPTASLGDGPAAGAAVPAAAGHSPGKSIGPYRLLYMLGEGGFGEVYLAEQEHPVRRRVALKIVKLGMDTRQVIARFEQERQALAIMDHPSVAKVFDAGATETGRPYFVMEYVQGEPITAYCDRNRLTVAERLALFIPVCEAVQHAHTKGIIHRDLKPSNILVSTAGDKPTPKVIDFGIAKAVSSRLTERTLFTERGVMIGTPEYMSPEQAEIGAVDIDTRTDVYSLGVVLYELLTGALPFESEELRSAAYARIQQIIREVEPLRPSARLTGLGERRSEVADRRRVRVEELTRALRGELEWIPLKAMRKDRRLRYRTPEELADDLRNYLAGLPLIAGPESAAYRARKFIGRNRGAAAATGAVAAALLLAVAGTSWGMVRERSLRTRAEAAEREAAARLAQSQAVQGFVREMFESIDPDNARGREVTVREILDAAAGRVGESLAQAPEAESAVRMMLGGTYHQLGRIAESEPHLRRALELRRVPGRPADEELYDSVNAVGVVLVSSGRPGEAEPHLREALRGRREVLGPVHADTLGTASVLGYALQLQGRMDDALAVYNETLAAQREHLGADAVPTLETMCSIADLQQDQGQLAGAEAVAREVVERAVRKHGEESRVALMGLSILGSVLENLGRYDEAEPVARRVVDVKTRIYGESHFQTMVSANVLGIVLEKLRRYDEAAALLRRTAEQAAEALGEEHESTLVYLANLGRSEQLRGNMDEAERLLRGVLQTRLRVTGREAQQTLIVQNNLALLLLDRGRAEEAETLFRDMLFGLEALLPEGHWMRSAARVNLADCLCDQKRYDEAEAAYLAGYAGMNTALGEDHPRVRDAARKVADMYRDWGKAEEEARWRALGPRGG